MNDPLIARLADERRAFLDAFARVPAARLAERPGAGRWSALEVAEHVSRVDKSVVRVINHCVGDPRATTPDERSAAEYAAGRSAMIRDRAHTFPAPDRVTPRGEMTAENALTMLADARAAMIETYRATSDEQLDTLAFPHPAIGPLTLRGWVAMSADHDHRHAAQLDEIAESLGR